MPKRWTKSEDRQLGTLPDPDIAKQLDRTTIAVKNRRMKLGIAAYHQYSEWRPPTLMFVDQPPAGH